MKILVPLNGELQSETVLPYVLRLAEFWKAEVLLLRVLDPMSATGDPLAANLLGRSRETRESAEQYLQMVAESLEEVSTSTLCLVGSAAEVICREASLKTCDLIVFAPHGHGGLERWLFGSVAEWVARHAACPVMLLRGDPNLNFSHILVPSDGSELSNQVCRHIPGQAQVTLLHCLKEAPAEKTLRLALEACVHGRPGWRLEIKEARAKTGIVDWALEHDCELIAMATHGQGGLAHLWAGSVTEHVARQAPCPVLVFPPGFLAHRSKD